MNTRNSKWEYVHVKNATSVNRNGWLLTGGVTFYKSNIQLNHLSISGAGGEDGLNIIDSKFELKNCSFLGASSDAFDGDFVQGKIENCLFKNILGDGLDFTEAVKASFTILFLTTLSSRLRPFFCSFSLSSRGTISSRSTSTPIFAK